MASYTGPCSGDCAPSGWRQTAALTTASLTAPSCPGGSGTGVSSPGTFDCEFFTDLDGTGCFKLTVVSATGNCTCIDTAQQIVLYPVTTGIWQSVDVFNLCNGCGLVRLDLTDPCCFPKLTVVRAVASGFTGPSGSLCGTGTDLVMRHVACGTDTSGRPYAEFSGGSVAVCGSYATTADCPACASTYVKYLFELDYVSTCQPGRGVLEYAGGCTWTGGLHTYTPGAGVPVTMVRTGTTLTVTFATGLTYSGTVGCLDTHPTLTLVDPGTCTDPQPTLKLCVGAPDPCSPSSFRVRVTCIPCVVFAACGCVSMPQVVRLELQLALGVDGGLAGVHYLSYVSNYTDANAGIYNFTGWIEYFNPVCQSDETTYPSILAMTCDALGAWGLKLYTQNCKPPAPPLYCQWAQGGGTFQNCDPVFGAGTLDGWPAGPYIDNGVLCGPNPYSSRYVVYVTDGSYTSCPQTPPARLTAACTADKAPGTYANGTTINFTCTPAGGTAPYTFMWNFSCLNGSSAAQNPSKTFTIPCSPGTPTYVLVTDANGAETYCSVGPFAILP